MRSAAGDNETLSAASPGDSENPPKKCPSILSTLMYGLTIHIQPTKKAAAIPAKEKGIGSKAAIPMATRSAAALQERYVNILRFFIARPYP